MNNKVKSPKRDSARIWVGLIIIFFGSILLADQLDINLHLPSWFVSWPMALIVVGFILGATSRFRNTSAYVLIGLGVFFILQREVSYNVWKLFFPLLIIGLGAWLLTDRKRVSRHRRSAMPGGGRPNATDPLAGDENAFSGQDMDQEEPLFATDWDRKTGGESEFVTSTAVFSEIKKQVFSKNFRGGEIVNIFGGTDINLMQADIQEPVVIDVFQIFAGTKLIVPAHWAVVSEVVSVFGEVDDRRFTHGGPRDPRKTVYLKGTSIFGGITIKSM